MNKEDVDNPNHPIPGTVSLAGASGDQLVDEFLVAKEPESKADQWINWISDFCSSILVKETRQAIKSRQFFSTFMLLLGAVVVWTFFALSPARDDYELDSLGAFMLCGFLFILGIPLVLIIPYTTFRSLAQEYEDGTIDMVLITTMKPWQIIAGKLGSAMLQVLIYVAVLAPCISFCYLLRGVDISQIWISLGGGVVVSLGLCCLAIGMASAADTNRAVQVLSVFLILALLFCAWIWCFRAWAICNQPIPAGQQSLVSLMVSLPVMGWVSTAILLFFAASAKISFPSSNRSTMLRVGVTIQVVLYVGCVLGLLAAFGYDKYVVMVSTIVAMHYLLLVGAMMVACHPGLSARVRRTLPSTVLKQSLFSLYMPGPGRAFLFVVGLASGVCVVFSVLVAGSNLFDVSFDIGDVVSGPSTFGTVEAQFALLTIWANFIYFMFFFCLVFIVSRFYAWRSTSKKPFVIEMGIGAALFVFLATLGSYAIDPNGFYGYARGFELTQVLNWYRVQYIAVDRNTGEAVMYMLLVGMPTLVMFYFCLRWSAPELSIARTMVPQRIAEENEELKRERLWGKDSEEETIDEIFAAVRPGNTSPPT